MVSDMTKFKVGDKVQIVCNPADKNFTWYPSNGDIDNVRNVELSKASSCNKIVYTLENNIYGWEETELELVTSKGDKNDMSEQVTAKEIKNLKLSEDDRLLLEAGLVDEAGNRTSEYDQVLLDKLAAQYKAEVVENIKTVQKAKEFVIKAEVDKKED